MKVTLAIFRRGRYSLIDTDMFKYIFIRRSSSEAEISSQPERNERSSIDEAAAWALLGTIFLVPLFFIPSVSVPFQLTKGMLIAGGIIISMGLWVVARLKEGGIDMPQNSLPIAMGAIVFTYLLSALFSGTPSISLTGTGFEADTVATVLLFGIAMALAPVVLRRRVHILYAYAGFLLSALLVGIFQALRLVFGTDFLSFGIFTSAISNLIGSWNDLGVFFGLSAVLSLTTLELLDTKRLVKIFSAILLAVSVVFLALINFTTVWYVLGVISLVFLVYTVSAQFGLHRLEEDASSSVSVSSLAVFIISLVFILAGGGISGAISDALGITHVSARPSWSSAWTVANQTLQESPLLGAGPNRFEQQWIQHKPEGVNNTLFWNTDFDAGVGYLPSVPIIAGLLGFVAWIIFLGLYLATGVKGIFVSIRKDYFTRFVTVSSFLASLYLWILTVFYVPNGVILFYTFVFTGIFLTALYQQGVVRNYRLSFVENPRAGFVAVLAMVVVLIGSVSGLYLFGKKYAAAVNFQRAVVQLNQDGDLQKARENITDAISLDQQERYYRALSQIHLATLNQLASGEAPSQTELQTELGAAIESARKATELDPDDYQNWMALGRVYESLVPQGVEGAYEQAKNAYDAAAERNSRNPAILLTQARLELANQNTEAAKGYIQDAIAMKQNYTEAVFLLSQIQAQEGDLASAIQSTQATAQLSPNDPTIFFQLGLLYYQSEDYQNAVSALQRATQLTPQYANAKYYLGLSYDKVGNQAAAIREFEEIQETNADNSEVRRILENLRAGRDPFQDIAATGDIEEREELPVEEE